MPPATSGAIRAGRAFVELFADATAFTRGLKVAERALQKFGDRVKDIGSTLLKTSLALSAPFVLAGRTFASYEQSMARVKALTGATVLEFRALGDEAKRLGESTIFSAAQTADAMGFFALAGFTVKEILDAIEPTLNLAAAGMLDVAEAADITVKTLRGMGIETQDVANAVDVLTKAMTTSNTTLEQLGLAMRFIGPIAKSAGTEFEEVVAAVQLLSNAGTQAEVAGTTLRGTFLTLTSPSRQAADALKKLQVRVADANDDMRPLADIIEDLEVKLKGLGSAKRLELLGTIFPARQAPGIAELISQGSDELRKFTAELRDAGGTAQKIANIQMNTLQGQITILKSALQGLGIEIGASFTGPVRIASAAVTEVVQGLSDWIEKNQIIILLLASSAVAMGTLGASLLVVGIGAKALAFVVGGLLLVKAAIAALFSPLALVGVALVSFGTQWLVWSDAAFDSVQTLIQVFGEFHDRATEVLKGIAAAIMANDMALATRILWLGIRAEWIRGTEFLAQIWEDWRQKFLLGANEALTGLLVVVHETWDAIKEAWDENIHALGTLWASFVAFWQTSWTNMQASAQKAWGHILTLFESDEFAEALQIEIEAERKLAVKDIEDELAEKLVAKESERNKQRQKNARDREARLTEIVKRGTQTREGLIEDREERKRRIEREKTVRAAFVGGVPFVQLLSELDLAREELANSIERARQKRDAQNEEEAAEVAKKSKRARENIELSGDKVGVRGAFFVSNALGLQADDESTRMVDGIEKIEKNTRSLRTSKNLAFG
jgi:TP901 family phage tail tape measure protein